MEKIDLHIHSSLSSDAAPSFEEIFRKLKKEGVTKGALTNHIPEPPGHVWYGDCGAVKKLKKQRDRLEDKYGIRVLVGAEIDVINNNGALALPDAVVSEFEIVISGVHRYPTLMRPLPNGESMHYGPAEYYAVSEGVLRNPLVTVLAHPVWAFDKLFPESMQKQANAWFPEIYKREIMRIASEEGKAVELNADEIWRMDDAWFEFGRQYGNTWSIGSDAHKLQFVGCVDVCYEAVKKYGIRKLISV